MQYKALLGLPPETIWPESSLSLFVHVLHREGSKNLEEGVWKVRRNPDAWMAH